MTDSLNGIERRHWATAEAAYFLGLSPRPLEKYRCHGGELGGRVVYMISDLQECADARVRISTSDPIVAPTPTRPAARQQPSERAS